MNKAIATPTNFGPHTSIARVTITASEISGTDYPNNPGTGRTFIGTLGASSWLRTKLEQESAKNPGAYGTAHADAPSAYLKTWITIVWADGERFDFRIDINHGVFTRAMAYPNVDMIVAELAARAAYSREKAGQPLVWAPELCELVETRLGQIFTDAVAA